MTRVQKPVPAPPPGVFSSKATLVLVPSSLLGQWEREIHKFTEGAKIITIHNITPMYNLTLKDLLEADFILCTCRLLYSQGYAESFSELLHD